MQLEQAYRNLPSADAEALGGRIQERRSQLQAGFELAEAAALRELAEARQKIGGIPVTNEGLSELDRLAQLPALQQVPTTEADAFREAITVKRGEIQKVLHREHEAEVVAMMEQAWEKLRNVPASDEGLQRLNQLMQLPVLKEIGWEKSLEFNNAVGERRNEINQILQRKREAKYAGLVADEVKRIEDFKVSEVEDLGGLWGLGNALGKQLKTPDARGVGKPILKAFWRRLGEEAEAMLPAFRERLDEIPENEEGLKRLGTAVVDVTGIERKMPIMKPYHDAVKARGQAMVEEMRRAACAKTLKAAGLSESDGEQPLWGKGTGTTLGEFVCAYIERGGQVHEYDSAGLFSSTHTLKLTSRAEGFHTVHLHEAEVAPDKEMLLGYELANANKKRALSVSDWEKYVATHTTAGGNRADCARLVKKPRSELSLEENMALMGCVMQMMFSPGS